MPLSFLRGVGDFLTDFIPGGDAMIDSLAANLISGGGGGARQDNPYIPDALERIYAPERFGTNGTPSPGTSGGNGMVGGCRVTMPIQQRAVSHCPPGYVAVDSNGDGVTDTCMLKEVAKACGLWRPRPKALLTASDRRTLSRASSVMKKVDTVVKQTNQIRGQARLTKSRPSSRK